MGAGKAGRSIGRTPASNLFHHSTATTTMAGGSLCLSVILQSGDCQRRRGGDAPLRPSVRPGLQPSRRRVVIERFHAAPSCLLSFSLSFPFPSPPAHETHDAGREGGRERAGRPTDRGKERVTCACQERRRRRHNVIALFPQAAAAALEGRDGEIIYGGWLTLASFCRRSR